MILLLIFFLVTRNVSFLMIVAGILIYMSYLIVSVYFQKRHNTIKMRKIPLEYKSGNASKKIVKIIGNCIINRTDNKNKFKLEFFDSRNNKLIFSIMSKQYYPQIDCNANFNDFGLIIEFRVNKDFDQLFNWLSENLPDVKYCYDVNNNKLIVSLVSNYFFKKFNGPIVAKLFYDYFELDDTVIVNSKYIYS